MGHFHRMVRPGPSPASVVAASDELPAPPADWTFLPAGDAAITRSVNPGCTGAQEAAVIA